MPYPIQFEVRLQYLQGSIPSMHRRAGTTFRILGTYQGHFGANSIFQRSIWLNADFFLLIYRTFHDDIDLIRFGWKSPDRRLIALSAWKWVEWIVDNQHVALEKPFDKEFDGRPSSEQVCENITYHILRYAFYVNRNDKIYGRSRCHSGRTNVDQCSSTNHKFTWKL